MNSKFIELGIEEPICKAIDQMGFEAPTKVQEESIPQILQHKDLIVLSKTGSGKTGAFGIPLLQLIDASKEQPQALILTPTRELAVQVDGEIKKMAKFTEVHSTAVYGQHSISTEIKAINKGAMLITGTPGRVMDHIQRKTLKTNDIKYLVLDEADRMLDMGFINQVIQIIKATPRDRMTLLFSATMPEEIQRICKSYMNDPIAIELETETKTVDTIKQYYYRIKREEKLSQLVRVLRYHQPESCMIFCNTRIEVDRVQNFLVKQGFHAEALHGANKQSQRMKTIGKFKEGKIQIMVATDVAARGIHIEGLSLVINHDVPEDKNSYVHRIGRTGRAGNSGLAITLVTSDDIMTLYEIEEHVGCLIDEEALPSDEAVAESVDQAKDSKWAMMPPPKTNHKTSKTKPKHKSTKSNSYDKSKHYKRVEDSDKTSRLNQQDNKKKVKTHVAQNETRQVHKKEIQQEKKTKVIMTKMGPVEVIVNEKEKKSFISRIIQWFTGA